MNTEELRDIAEEMDREDILADVVYIENEGDDCVRVDYGREQSVWLYTSGNVTGKVSPKATKYLTSKGFTW